MTEPQHVRQALAYAAWLDYHGLESVSQWVGTAASDLPFNSLEQLVADHGSHDRAPYADARAGPHSARTSGHVGVAFDTARAP